MSVIADLPVLFSFLLNGNVISYLHPVVISQNSVLLPGILAAISLIVCFLLFVNYRKQIIQNGQLQREIRLFAETNEKLKKSIKEISYQKELLKKERNESDIFYKMLVQSADDGISFYDSSWNLKYANSAFYSLVGYDRNEYDALNPYSIVHPDDRDYQDRRMNSLLKEGMFDSELRLLHKKGHYLHLSTRSVIVRSEEGAIIGSLTISRDISRLKQALNELVKANEVAEASNRLKSNFLANISHEIRTPLNSVVGFSNLLLAEDVSAETRTEYVEHINFNSEKLLQIIGDIIDLSRLESSQIEIRYEETSINSLIEEISRETRVIIKRNEKPIILNVRNNFREHGDLVFTDRIWLKRVLNHLLDNAVKFTLDGSVDFICSLEDGKILFRVKDTGIGINRENLNRIFEEFRQEVDGHQRPFEGLGVGLTLSREVVERMGGKIFVNSEKGMGSEFGISIPYRPAGGTRLRAVEAANDLLIASPDWKGRKCLLVDDNKDVIIYLTRILAETGIEILPSRSGYEALQLLKFTPEINIVLLDMQMPEMNGIEVTREIRKIRPDIHIVAQTAFIFENDKDIILEAGCDACLIKPIRREQLLSVMKGFLE
ncbi:MAG TPA: ATP-binding protein [Bacteroidales bacterium]|nr:ATP-binding protein [Bacteroidales bacterium]